ncbi:carbohydrate-binding domain-containing protein [Acetobacterium wieringae]|uniref:carbohydrate-binding domain-containing protein n=1 Tax=Acetobacterium wieringae TaxID=52694 RepID=UPI00203473D0|nr:carbohydrate-binding domain-containing protein [Acetobacterium wieringae]URN84553.1 carbohydrate-binding domain-containing protein [Acetobacterium wieringae]
MKRLKRMIPFLLVIMVFLGGCSSNSQTTTAESTAEAVTETTAVLSAVVSPTSTVVVDPEFTDRDLETSYDDATAVQVTLDGSTIQVTGDGATASNGVLTITKEGTYVVTGNLSDGQIVVAAADTDKIQIVLNGATINCADNAPIYVKSANKVFITLAANTVNTLTDGSAYVQTDDNTVDGVIFSKADLTLNGEGTLNITANYKDAIVSKDDLVITGGTYTINAAKNGLSAKDAVKIKDGTITITAPNGKAITSQNDEDATKGYVYIAGGTIKITNSNEGIEGTAIVVEGGTIDLISKDDGFNAASPGAAETESGGRGAGMEADSNAYLSIAGGTIFVNASGDGLDSNGNVYISGGTVEVSGPTNNGNGALDYNGTADVSGGTVVIAGSTGMAQSFSETSTQASLLYNLTSSCAAGTEIKLTDASGKTVVSYTPDKTYQSVVISTPDLVQGSTYTLICGSQTVEIPLTGMVTSNGQTGMGGPGQGQPQGGQKPQ